MKLLPSPAGRGSRGGGAFPEARVQAIGVSTPPPGLPLKGEEKLRIPALEGWPAAS